LQLAIARLPGERLRGAPDGLEVQRLAIDLDGAIERLLRLLELALRQISAALEVVGFANFGSMAIARQNSSRARSKLLRRN